MLSPRLSALAFGILVSLIPFQNTICAGTAESPRTENPPATEPTRQADVVCSPWVHQYGETETYTYDSVTDVAVDSAGYVYYAAMTLMPFHVSTVSEEDLLVERGIYLAKYSPAGEIQWLRQWDLFTITKLILEIGKDDAIYLCSGFFFSADFSSTDVPDIRTSKGDEDAFVIKMTPDGLQEWTRTWGGPSEPSELYKGDEIQAVAPLNSGGIAIAGIFMGPVVFETDNSRASLDAGGLGIFLMELDPNGNALFLRSVSHNSSCYVYDIAVDSSDSITLLGDLKDQMDFDLDPGTFSLTANGHSGFLLRLDPHQRIEWARKLPASMNSRIRTVGEETILAIGASSDTDAYGELEAEVVRGSAYIAELDKQGSIKWLKSIGDDTRPCFFYDLVCGRDGTIVAAGSVYDMTVDEPGSYPYDSLLVRISRGGEPVVERFGSDKVDMIYGLAMDSGGCMYFTAGFIGRYLFPEDFGLDPVDSVYGFDSLIVSCGNLQE